MSTGNHYKTMVTDPDTGLCANATYSFGKLEIEDFGGDPLLQDSWDDFSEDQEQAKAEAVKEANARASRAEGRYSSVEAAVQGLIDAGYAMDEARELHW